jgi:hypothetical protein
MRTVRLHTFVTSLIAAATGVFPVVAQTTGGGTSNTCTTAPTSIDTFNIERTLSLTSNTGVFTTMTPTIPPNILQAITSGAIEVRERAVLNTTNNTIMVQAFTVQPGSPSPTTPSTIASSSVLYNYRISVQDMYFSCKPVPSGVIVGTIQNNSPLTPFGDLVGSLAVITFGYTTDNPPKLNNVNIIVPGVAGLYTASAVGTLQFPSGPVTPPGTNQTGPVVVITGGNTQVTSQRQIVLDASQSMDPNHLQLMYEWTQVNKNVQAAINNGNTAMPLITFTQTGDYTFEVTVTNSAGQSSTAQVTISYTGGNI